jgi:two-component SAPR family response regulator
MLSSSCSGAPLAAVSASSRVLKPDIVILDQSLPDLTGIQTAYEIRQLLDNVKIVFFTVHDETVMSSAARVVGAASSSEG